MRSMQWQLGMLVTISAYAYRQRETKENLCRGGRSQDLPNTDFQPTVDVNKSRYFHLAGYQLQLLASVLLNNTTRLQVRSENWQKQFFPAIHSFRQHYPNSHRQALSLLFCLMLVLFVQRIENCVLYLRNPVFGPRALKQFRIPLVRQLNPVLSRSQERHYPSQCIVCGTLIQAEGCDLVRAYCASHVVSVFL